MKANFPYVGSAYLFLIRNDQILLQRRYKTGFEDGNYGVPAGHLEGNETAREGCAREAKEEIGIDIIPADLSVVHIMHRKGTYDERIDFFMTPLLYKGEVRNCEPNKCDNLSWFGLSQLPDNMVDYKRVAIEAYRGWVVYSKFGWNK